MRRHVGRAMVALVVTAAAVGVATATVVAPAAAAGHPPTSCPTGCSALDRAGQALVGRPDGPPGLIVLVDRDDAVGVHSFGTAVVGQEAPITSTDHLRLASVSKAYSGAVALALVADGVLHLSDTVGRWLHGMPCAWDDVTLAELLQHTSGIPDFSRSPAFIEALLDSLLDPPPPIDLVRFAFPLKMAFTPPGSSYAYSNTDNILVALMVQAATGHSYGQELDALVLSPLGLDQTSLPRGAVLPEPYAHGYRWSRELRRPTSRTSSPPGGRGRRAGWWRHPPISTGSSAPTPVAPRRPRRSTCSSSPSARVVGAQGPGTNSAGLAIFRYATRCGTVYGHTGNTSGYTQFAAATADGSRSVVVSVNAQITPSTAPGGLRRAAPGRDPGRLRRPGPLSRRRPLGRAGDRGDHSVGGGIGRAGR